MLTARQLVHFCLKNYIYITLYLFEIALRFREMTLDSYSRIGHSGEVL